MIDLEDDPILEALQSWKDAGVLDAPEQISRLEKVVRDQGALLHDLSQQNKALAADLRALAQQKAAADVETAELRGLVKSLEGRPVSSQGATINLSASGLAEQLGEVLSKSVADVVNKTLERALVAPTVNVETDVASLGKTIADGLAPALEMLAQPRETVLPAPLVNVGETAVTVDTLPMAEAINEFKKSLVALPAPEVLVNLEPLVEQNKLLRKCLEKMAPPDLTPILKALERQGERIDKALQPPERKPRTKKLSQDYDGGWTITETE